MDIAEVARRTGLPSSTLRYYEKKGLIRPSRTVGHTRMYSADDVEEIARLLRLTRDLGVNLAGKFDSDQPIPAEELRHDLRILLACLLMRPRGR